MKKLSFLLILTLNVIVAAAQKPILQWTFDAPDFSSKLDSVEGELIFKEGVSGKTLVFDGYNTDIIRKSNILLQ